MQAIHLFELTSQQARWLAARQSVVAENVANANTPGFESADLPPFVDVLDDTSIRMAATNQGHLGVEPMASEQLAVKEAKPWEKAHSGNSVSLEHEMMKAGEVNRAFSLNMNIVKAFNQMLLASVKG